MGSINVQNVPKFTAPPHVSLHLPSDLSSFGDVCVESDATNNTIDSEAPNQIRRLNRLHLKVKCLPFPKNRSSVQYSPKNPARKFFGSSESSAAPSPLSPSFIDALKNSMRLGKRCADQRSQSDAIEVEIRAHAADSQASIPSGSSVSRNYKPGQSMIVKDLPSVAEAVTGWKRLPPRLPIPKWDVDD
ncbi:hypothetical protein BDR07DRAFT_1406905 [Suillus spraguei]|nr:hypothetical protein BDR07DRAFT_1406905 [Suillus spraguei]